MVPAWNEHCGMRHSRRCRERRICASRCANCLIRVSVGGRGRLISIGCKCMRTCDAVGLVEASLLPPLAAIMYVTRCSSIDGFYTTYYLNVSFSYSKVRGNHMNLVCISVYYRISRLNSIKHFNFNVSYNKIMSVALKNTGMK